MMKFIIFVAGLAILMMLTGCVAYAPAPYYAYGPGYQSPYTPVYGAPPPAPAVVVDPFSWLFAPWYFDGYYGHHSDYREGYHGGYRGGGNHGGGGGHH